MLQALNILERLRSEGDGLQFAALYQYGQSDDDLAWADRDFYYGDIYTAPEKPVKGLLSKEYAKDRATIDQRRPQ